MPATREQRTNEHVMAPQEGYDRAAALFDRWHWHRFWRSNEAPLVRQWLQSVRPGLGLDAGSGTGAYAQEIRNTGRQYIAADLSWHMLRRQSHPNRVQANIASLPFSDASFDWVLCTRVLSHVEDLGVGLSELARVQRTGAELFITDVHPNHPYEHTAIRARRREIAIQTYKHSIDHLLYALHTARLECVALQEYRVHDLAWQPPRGTFAKLQDDDNPVFYTCHARRL